MKIAHFADVHFRGLSRHEEYRKSFIDAFRSLRDEKPDVIYVGGDIVHSKTQGITPELIDILTWWFTELATIAPVEVILGNHDGLILNKDRQDAITPIITALDNNRIRLYKASGTYNSPDDRFAWCVFSPFDVEGWKNVIPVDGKINIAFYHGAVKGAKSDSGIELDGEINLDLFEKFDFALLGDIHKRQFLNDAGTVAYCGSTIQQNYGEDLDKGYLIWDITSHNKFTTKFVRVANDSPFITIEWQDGLKQTLTKLQSASNLAKIRYNVPNTLSDVEIKSLHEQTRNAGNFAEILVKVNDDNSLKNASEQTHLKSENLRDKSILRNVIDDYLSTKKVDLAKRQLSLENFERYYDSVLIDDEVTRNIVWSLKTLEFDNMFSYGSKNFIDFDKLSGITGIFGKNRSGKSSIIGTIAYALFNTTDRGTMKNLHLINSDEDMCRAKITMSVAEEEYEIERESNKVYSKKSDTSASTKLSLKKKSTGDVLKDLNDEQRRETEKIVRKLIGTSDDFFYTCLAPQGQMNMFINEKSTSRKQILSRFLDLDIFDVYHDKVKQDLAPIKASLKNSASIDVLTKTKEDLITQKETLQKELDESSQKLSSKRDLLESLKKPDNVEIISDADVENAGLRVKRIEGEIADIENKLTSLKVEIKDLTDKSEKIKSAMSVISIDDLKKQESDIKDLEMKYAINLKDHESKEQEVARLVKRSKILDEIPCGDSFKTCIFIKDAHESKTLIKSQEDARDAIQRTLEILKDRLSELNAADIKSKIEKVSKLSELKNDISQQIVKLESSITIYDERLSNKQNAHTIDLDKLKSIKEKKANQEDSDVEKIHQEYLTIRQEISNLEKNNLLISTNIGRCDEKILNTTKQITELLDAIKRQETLTILENAFSKKGIPQSIISKNLPLINCEVSKILDGISGFTVEIECDDSNNIEIYLNYGDRRRIIELGSGMEKMIASIAIRVALTNISSLPKSDMLIIDEGFGALDENNLEACSRLLQNLKSYFKKIVIISHVDAIKDVVDNMLSVESHNNRSKVIHV
jgi:ABC-type molybdenum transport system ATPase subunit/photorepair protein PhrA